MKTVTAYEAKTHLPRFLKRVESGEQFVITRHGSPVAKLVPIDPRRPANLREVVEEMKALRRGRKVAPGEIRQMIEEGRR